MIGWERTEWSVELEGLAVVQHAKRLDRVVMEVLEANEVAYNLFHSYNLNF